MSIFSPVYCRLVIGSVLASWASSMALGTGAIAQPTSHTAPFDLASAPAAAPRPTAPAQNPRQGENPEADRHLQQGIDQFDQNQLEAALQTWQKALTLYRASQDRWGEGETLRNMGRAYYWLKQPTQALAHFQQGLAIAREVRNRQGEGRTLSSLGRIHHDRQEFSQAMDYYTQSRAIAEAIQDDLGVIIALDNLGSTYQATDQLTQAIDTWQISLGIARKRNWKDEESYALTSIGIAYYNLKEYQKSIEFHQKSLAIDTELNNRSRVAMALRNIGLAYQVQRNFSRAFQLFEQSLAVRRGLKDSAKVIDLLEAMAKLAYEQQDFPRAIAYYEQTRLAARESGNRLSELLALRNLGIIYNGLKRSDENLEKAVKFYTDSLQVAQALGDKAEEGKSLRGLGILYMNYNRFKPALDHFQKSLALWRALNNPAMESNVLVNLGNLYATRMGTRGETWCPMALEYYGQSLPILRQLQHQALEASVLAGLGYCYEELGKPQQALPYQQQGLAIAQKIKDPLLEGLAWIGLGKIQRSLGNLPQARQQGEQGLAMIRALQNHTHEVGALDILSGTYARAGEHRKAIEAQTQRILVAQKHNIKMVEGGFNAVAVNIEQAKKFDYVQHQRRQYQLYRSRLEALGFPIAELNLSESNILSFSFLIRESLMSLGDSYDQSGDQTRALMFYQAALDPDYEKGYSYGFTDIKLMGKIGSILTRMGRLKEAEAILRLALKYGEEFRTSLGYAKPSATHQWNDSHRILLAERQIENFQQLQRALAQQNRPEAALEIAEESRARTFVELLSARISGRPLPDGDNLPAALKLDAIRQIAKTQNATLVQYSIVGPDLLYIWVVKPTGELTFRSTALDPALSIKQLVAHSRTEIGVRGRAVGKPIARTTPSPGEPSPVRLPGELGTGDVGGGGSDPLPSPQPDHPASINPGNLKKLHQLLIDPIAQDLPTDPQQRVIFLPQGELFLVPFAALPNAQGTYLIERHTLSTAPSIQTLALTHDRAKQAKSTQRAVVVGDPKMPRLGDGVLSALPGARQEAIAIAKRLNATPLLGEQATKSAVLAQIQSADVIHLATHGMLDTVQGDMPGAIALAPNGQDSGLLSASEIFDLKLNARLVVLSACDTGRGDITGDGVVGLSRSWVAAGASSVLVSLWAVDDGSTQHLMGEFYHHLSQTTDKAQALRQAMLKTIQRYPNPVDWAAFTLVGESQTTAPLTSP
jgi:CHAT domain-containing protein/uncharacterized protein HemY